MDDLYVISQDIMTCNEPYIFSAECESINSTEDHSDLTNDIPQPPLCETLENGETVDVISDVEYAHCPLSEMTEGQCWQINGLWHNDHCYSISPLTQAKSSLQQMHTKLASSDVLVRCVCIHTDIDDDVIQCQQCKTWQHEKCVLPESTLVPQNYRCEVCVSKENHQHEKQSCTKVRYVLPADRAAQAARIILKSRLLTKEELGFTKIQENVFSEELTRVLHIQQMNGSGNSTGAESLLRELHNRLVPCYRVVPLSFMSSSSSNLNLSLLHQATQQDVQQSWRLESARQLCRGEPVAEICGYVSIRAQWDEEADNFHGYQLFYDGFEGFQLCLDANEIGNDARFIRRSCSPTCEVRHLFCDGRLYFVIIALQDISIGVELSIPFDMAINYVDSMLNSNVSGRNVSSARQSLTCACTRGKLCRLQQWRVSLANHQSAAEMNLSSRVVVPPGSLELYAAHRKQQHFFASPPSGLHGSRKSPLRPRSSVIQVPSVKNLSSLSTLNCQNQLTCRQGHHPRLSPFQQQKLQHLTGGITERDRAWLQKEKALRREQEIQLLRRQRSAQIAAHAHYRPQSAASTRPEQQKQDDDDHVLESRKSRSRNNSTNASRRTRRRSDSSSNSADDTSNNNCSSSSNESADESNENKVSHRQARPSMTPIVSRHARVRQNSTSLNSSAINKQQLQKFRKEKVKPPPPPLSSDRKRRDSIVKASIRRSNSRIKSDSKSSVADDAANSRESDEEQQQQQPDEIVVSAEQLVKTPCKSTTSPATTANGVQQSREERWLAAQIAAIERMENRKQVLQNKTLSSSLSKLISSIEDHVDNKVNCCESSNDVVVTYTTPQTCIDSDAVTLINNTTEEKNNALDEIEPKTEEISGCSVTNLLNDESNVQNDVVNEGSVVQGDSIKVMKDDADISIGSKCDEHVAKSSFSKKKKSDSQEKDRFKDNLKEEMLVVEAAIDETPPPLMMENNKLEVQNLDDDKKTVVVKQKRTGRRHLEEISFDQFVGLFDSASEVAISVIDKEVVESKHSIVEHDDSSSLNADEPCVQSTICKDAKEVSQTESPMEVENKFECQPVVVKDMPVVSPTSPEIFVAASDGQTRRRTQARCTSTSDGITKRRRSSGKTTAVDDIISNQLLSEQKSVECEELVSTATSNSPVKELSREERWTLAMWRRIQATEQRRRQKNEVIELDESTSIVTPVGSVSTSARKRTRSSNDNSELLVVDNKELSPKKKPQPSKIECEVDMMSDSCSTPATNESCVSTSAAASVVRSPRMARRGSRIVVNNVNISCNNNSSVVSLPVDSAELKEVSAIRPLIANECEFIIYSKSEQQKDPLAKYMRQTSQLEEEINSGSAAQEEEIESISQQQATCMPQTPATATKKRWLYKAYQEEELHVSPSLLSTSSSSGVEAIPLKKRLKIHVSSAEEENSELLSLGGSQCASSDVVAATVVDNLQESLCANSSTFFTPSCPKKAFLMRGVALEKAKIRMSLSDYINRRGASGSTQCDFILSPDKHECGLGNEQDLLKLAAMSACDASSEEVGNDIMAEEDEVEKEYLLNKRPDDIELSSNDDIRMNVDATVTPASIDMDSVMQESEVIDDADLNRETSIPKSSYSFFDDNFDKEDVEEIESEHEQHSIRCPLTPEDSAPESEDGDSNDIVNNFAVFRPRTPEEPADDSSDSVAASEDEDEDLAAELRTLEEIKARDAEIRTFQELQTLEREKTKIEYQIRHEEAREKRKEKERQQHAALLHHCRPQSISLPSSNMKKSAPAPLLPGGRLSAAQSFTQQHYKHHGSVRQRPIFLSDGPNKAAAAGSNSLRRQEEPGMDRLAAIQARLAANLAQLAGPSASAVAVPSSSISTKAPKLLNAVSHTIFSMKKEISKLTVQLSEQLNQIKEASCQHVPLTAKLSATETTSGALCVQEADSTVHDELC